MKTDTAGPLEYLPQQRSCFARTLQLVIKDADKLKNTLAKVSSIVSHVSRLLLQTVFTMSSAIQPAKVTWWNSQTKMVRSILACDAEKLS